MNSTPKVTTLCLAMVLSSPALALSQAMHSVTLGGPFLQVTGDARLGTHDLDVDLSVDEVLDKLELGGVLDYRLESPKWSFMAEGAFVGLGQSAHGLAMDMDITIVEADLGYRFNEYSEVFAGVRYTELTAEVAGAHPVSGDPFAIKNDDEFVDPLIGLRFATPLSESGKWRLQGRGDIGGFGVSMNLTWQAIVDLGYRPGEAWTFWLGYRALSQDFDDAGKDGRFAMDVLYQGPQVGVTWAF